MMRTMRKIAVNVLLAAALVSCRSHKAVETRETGVSLTDIISTLKVMGESQSAIVVEEWYSADSALADRSVILDSPAVRAPNVRLRRVSVSRQGRILAERSDTVSETVALSAETSEENQRSTADAGSRWGMALWLVAAAVAVLAVVAVIRKRL